MEHNDAWSGGISTGLQPSDYMRFSILVNESSEGPVPSDFHDVSGARGGCDARTVLPVVK